MLSKSTLHLYSHPPTEDEIRAWIGLRATDGLGKEIGKISGVIAGDNAFPYWLVVQHRTHHRLVPALDAAAGAGAVFLPYEHDVIESAPQVSSGVEPNQQTLQRAAEHYGV